MAPDAATSNALDVTEPQQDTIADLAIVVADASVVVLGLPAVELEDESPARAQSIMVRTMVVAAQPE